MHILFLNPQGNFDAKDSYWTEHPDFGGQLVYVKEVAMALTKLGHTVDIVTRQIMDPDWEEFKDSFDSYGGSGLRIVRIPCGPNAFLPKELLWEFLGEWVHNIIEFYKNEGKTPDFVTAHYGDGGLAAAMLYEKTGIPYSFTAHSLGAQKMDKLEINLENIHEMEKKFHFTKRIYAENVSMGNSAINFVSTKQEQVEQYKHKAYSLGNGDDEKFAVVPPGANTYVFSSYERNAKEDYVGWYVDKTFKRDLERNRLHLPCIVASSRLDAKKNHVGLVRAYALNEELKERANLVIVVRGIENPFEDYSILKGEEHQIMSEILSIIDEYQLKGKVSFLNLGSQLLLAATYRYLSNRHSIFALTSLYEPFGLAPIEAMSCGLPAVVTRNGGPKDVMVENGEEYGILVDPTDPKDIARGLIKALNYQTFYKKQGMYRVQSKYTWEATAKGYANAIESVLASPKEYKVVEIHEYFMNPGSTNTIGIDWLLSIYNQ